MQHFPIFLDLTDRRVAVSGGGEAALAKLRLLLKTEARIEVFAAAPAAEIGSWAATRRLTLIRRGLEPGDALGAALVYGANEDTIEDARIAAIARAEGALVNIVDDLSASDFLTPAIVDRNPVTIAIGTEGAAPVLARALKTDLEARLSSHTGPLARLGKTFRKCAEALPPGAARRAFWAEWFDAAGPRAWAAGGEPAALSALDALLARHLRAAPAPGHVDFVGAGPGDPDLLTLKARKALDRAEVVIHDPTVGAQILDLARREAILIAAERPDGDMVRIIVEHGRAGRHVVRLTAGDPSLSRRIAQDRAAVAAVGLSCALIPAASAAATGSIDPALAHPAGQIRPARNRRRIAAACGQLAADLIVLRPVASLGLLIGLAPRPSAVPTGAPTPLEALP